MNNITFQKEKYDQIIEEGIPLLERHRDEIAEFPEIMVLDVDHDLYRALEGKEQLFIETVRQDNKLVGYMSVFLHRHPHYKQMVHAAEDVHFVQPENRDAFTGIMLIKHAEKAMRERKAHLMTLRTKWKHNHGRIFERLGYRPLDVVWGKQLDRD